MQTHTDDLATRLATLEARVHAMECDAMGAADNAARITRLEASLGLLMRRLDEVAPRQAATEAAAAEYRRHATAEATPAAGNVVPFRRAAGA